MVFLAVVSEDGWGMMNAREANGPGPQWSGTMLVIRGGNGRDAETPWLLFGPGHCSPHQPCLVHRMQISAELMAT